MKRLLLLCTLLLGAIAPTFAQEETTFRTLEHDGLQRGYHLHVPDDADKLLLALHPFASSGKALEVVTGLSTIAGEAGFAVAYPNSAGFYWDDGRDAAGLSILPPEREPVDEFSFLTTLIDSIIAETGIPADQVYLTGMANGGTMALALACEMPERFAGAVIVSALMWSYHLDNCATDGAPIDILFINGQLDHVYQLNGNNFPQQDVDYRIGSAQETIDFWTQRNRCDANSVERYDGTTLQMLTACADGTQTGLFVVRSGGNNWPRQDYRLNQFGVDAGEILVNFFTADNDTLAASTQQSDPPQLRPRTWNLYVPDSYDPAEPLPLLINLHGRTATANNQAYTTNMNEIAAREGFIVLYPEGLDRQWNYTLGLPQYAAINQNDDQFLINLQDDLAQDLSIDPQRIYVAGLSNGGFMTQRLACTGNDRYAAFVSVAATAPEGIQRFCAQADPVPMLFIHGTEDSIVPFEGIQDENGEFVSLPLELSANLWANFNGCAIDFERDVLPANDEDSTTTILYFQDCPDGADVTVYLVIGGGHVWPGVRDFQSDLLGEVSMDFNASEVVWEYVSQYTLDMRPERPEPDPSEGARELVGLLREGGYLLFINQFAADTSPNCDAVPARGTHLSEEDIANTASIRDALTALDIPIGEVVTSTNCAAQEMTDMLFEDSEAQAYNLDGQGLALLLSVAPEEGTNGVIIADALMVLQGGQLPPPGMTFIIEPATEAGYDLLVPIPVQGWQTLLDAFAED